VEEPQGQTTSDFTAALPALSLRQVRYFVALSHCLSFTQAAQLLGVTQPALTAAIRQMETVMGGRLFDRSSQGLALTPAGTAALPLAEHLLNTARGSFDDMLRIFAEDRQTIRIGLIPSAAGRLFPVLASLRAAHPALRLELRDLPNNVLLQAIQSGSVDLGVGVRDDLVPPTELVCQDLFRDEIMAVLRRDDPLARAAELSWAQLAGRELAVFMRGNVSDLLLRTASIGALPVRPKYRMEYTEPLYALVRSGLGIAVMPRLYTRDLHDPALAVVELKEPRVSRVIALISPRQPDRGPQVGVARDWILRNI
jgi:DNA-binding transcriptional LysR family regulator